MGYKFTCTECAHSWDVAFMGPYKPEMITSHPCPKCDVKAIVAERVDAPKVEFTEKSAAIIRSEPSMRPSGDFINHLQQIKKAHKNNTMDDKWT